MLTKFAILLVQYNSAIIKTGNEVSTGDEARREI